MAFDVEKFMEKVTAQNPGEVEFLQAVREVVESLADFIDAHPKYIEHKVLERMVEPERSISFRVPWVDDNGEIQINRGYRVQFNNAIGPYKGGLRFHPSVNLGIIKFLGLRVNFYVFFNHNIAFQSVNNYYRADVISADGASYSLRE